MSLDYVDEKLSGAIETLAVYDLPLRERLLNTYIGAFDRLDVADFPESLKASFLKIKLSLEKKVDLDEALARSIMELYFAVLDLITDSSKAE